jgi:hypothetical protein
VFSEVHLYALVPRSSLGDIRKISHLAYKKLATWQMSCS